MKLTWDIVFGLKIRDGGIANLCVQFEMVEALMLNEEQYSPSYIS